METIKAIETSYKGYKFRSRLEARWAVFFDGAGIKWEYEVEGLDLDGEWYLPDFWFPHWRCYVEIKPDAALLQPAHVSLAKPYALARAIHAMFEDAPGLIVIVGNPWPWEYGMFEGRDGNLVPFPTAQFAECNNCGRCSVVVSDRDATRAWDHLLIAHDKSCKPCDGQLCWSRDRMPEGDRGIDAAYRAARGERFGS